MTTVELQNLWKNYEASGSVVYCWYWHQIIQKVEKLQLTWCVVGMTINLCYHTSSIK
jgi:hypothetical protein